MRINQHLEFVDVTERYSMWTRDSMGKSTEHGEKSYYQKMINTIILSVSPFIVFYLNVVCWVGGTAHWYSGCQPCMRLWQQSSVPKETQRVIFTQCMS